ncbi:hypothetical protein D3C81_2086110 [compost metagenome]
MAARRVVIGCVVAPIVVLLPKAQPPGALPVDSAVGIGVLHICVEQAGLSDLVAGLTVSKTAKGAVCLCQCTGTEYGHCKQ